MMNYRVVAKKNPITKEVKYYVQLAPVTPTKLASLADAISKECTVTVHDVKAVLSAIQEHILRLLIDGKSVRLGDLGSFHPTLCSDGAATADEVTTENIRRVRVRFRCSKVMRNGLQLTNPEMSFRRMKGANG